MLPGEALDVDFVDHRLVPGHGLPAGFAVPVEIGIDDHAFGHERRAVALVEGEVVAGFHLVAEHRRIPFQRPGMGAGVGVEQQFVRVEAMPGLGLIRAVNAVAVEGARSDIRQIAVKNLVGIFGKFDPA